MFKTVGVKLQFNQYLWDVHGNSQLLDAPISSKYLKYIKTNTITSKQKTHVLFRNTIYFYLNLIIKHFKQKFKNKHGWALTRVTRYV